MRKRHINEFLKTSFIVSGRAAGHGMVEDDYSDESSPDRYIRRSCRPVPISEREENAKKERDEAPVTVYFIETEVYQ